MSNYYRVSTVGKYGTANQGIPSPTALEHLVLGYYGINDNGPIEFSIKVKGLKPDIRIERGNKFSQECDKTPIEGPEAEGIKTLIDKILPELLLGVGVYSKVAEAAKQDFAEKLEGYAAAGDFRYFYQFQRAHK